MINDQASVMLLREDFFHGFHDTQPHTGTETTICLRRPDARTSTGCARRRARPAPAITGSVDEPPMYGGSFRDPDGHIWEVLWMETS